MRTSSGYDIVKSAVYHSIISIYFMLTCLLILYVTLCFVLKFL